MELGGGFWTAAQLFILIYFVVINSIYTLLILLAFVEVHSQARRAFIDDYASVLKSRLAPGLSIIVPCYNEEATIVDNVHSLLTARYPMIEAVVVNDGSTDATLERLIEEFELVRTERVLREDVFTEPVRGVYRGHFDPRLVVVDKENGGGKADALNAGLNASRMPYVLTLDADVVLDEDALLRIMKPIIDDPGRVVAGGGIVRIVNGCTVRGGQVVGKRLPTKPIVLFQIVEYFRAFTAGRAGFARLNALPIVSGAFSILSAAMARRVGGFDRTTIGEDLEIIIKLHRTLRREKRSDYRVFYAAFPICWTEVPESWRTLGRQRSRWHRGLSESLWRHRSMVLNPRYGRIGMFSVPVFFYVEWLGPLVELTGYAYFILLLTTNQLGSWFFFPFLTVAILWGMLLSVLAVVMQDMEFRWLSRWSSLIRLLAFSLIENLGYRQLTLFWRVRGFFNWALHRQGGWGVMPRKGFTREGD